MSALIALVFVPTPTNSITSFWMVTMTYDKTCRVVGIVSFAFGLAACSNIVPLTEARYPWTHDTVTVRTIDARGMSRAELEDVLRPLEFIGRFGLRLRHNDEFEEKLAEALDESKAQIKRLGADVLLYTDDSELVAAIAQDARYAGLAYDIVVYVLRSGGR